MCKFRIVSVLVLALSGILRPGLAADDRPPRRGDPTGADRALLGVDAQVRCLAYEPDGRTLVTGDMEGTLAFYDADTGCRRFAHRIATPPKTRGWVDALAMSPDGRALAFGLSSYTDDFFDLVEGSNEVRLWDPRERRERRLPSADYDGLIDSLAFSPDAKFLATASGGGTIRIWDVDSGQYLPVLDVPRREHRRSILFRVAFSPDGSLLAVAGGHYSDRDGDDEVFPDAKGDVLLYDWKARKIAARWREKFGLVRCLGFSPDGKTLAFGVRDTSTVDEDQDRGRDDLLKLRDIAGDGPTRVFRGSRRVIYDTTFHPGGKVLAAGDGDRRVRLWAVASGELLATFGQFPSTIRALAFSPDGRTLAVAWSYPPLGPGGDVVINPSSGVLLFDLKLKVLDRELP